MLILVLCLDRQTRKVFTSFYKDSISIYILSMRQAKKHSEGNEYFLSVV